VKSLPFIVPAALAAAWLNTAGSLRADEPTIDPKTVAAWRDHKTYPVFVSIERQWGTLGSYERARLIDPVPGFQFTGRATDHELKGLPAVSVPFAIDLGEGKFADASLKHLRGVKNLSSLLLYGPNYTDAGLDDLTALDLTTLGLHGTKVSAAGLGRLKVMKNLTGLSLALAGYPDYPDEALVSLKDMKQLTALNLENARVTDEGMANLKGLTGLKVLNLKLTGVSNGGLRELKDLKGLTALYLLPQPPARPIDDDGMKVIAGFEKLAALDLRGARVTDRSLPQLKALKNLTVLIVAHSQLTKAGVKELRAALPACKIVED
jgi:hypothetical protein